MIRMLIHAVLRWNNLTPPNNRFYELQLAAKCNLKVDGILDLPEVFGK